MGCFLEGFKTFLWKARFYSQVGELSGTLRAVQDEKSNLLVAQSTLNEEHLRLKEEMETAREELHRMESQMIDSQLKEAETSQQLMETTEQLMKARADLEHFTVENGRMLTSLEEANRKVSLSVPVKEISYLLLLGFFLFCLYFGNVYLVFMYLLYRLSSWVKKSSLFVVKEISFCVRRLRELVIEKSSRTFVPHLRL